MKTLLQCGHTTEVGPTIRAPARHKDWHTCPQGCGLQRRETSAKKRKAAQPGEDRS